MDYYKKPSIGNDSPPSQEEDAKFLDDNYTIPGIKKAYSGPQPATNNKNQAVPNNVKANIKFDVLNYSSNRGGSYHLPPMYFLHMKTKQK